MVLDPEEVERRNDKVIKRRVYESSGLMNNLHIDGDDKLKTFGFPIHRCIDGLSRKLMWLVASTSNNDIVIVLALST